ncbi:MAG: hypothetical protein H6590_06340 [Flavobacteriales bacterium]|nr:hypothetical protein [Flavobacteriales bacterium]MCB9179024.1 hypothetical protein [Flavobacteriales bacterium]HPF89979.1 hypothetical protein [Flavobacteriales bacterium]
MTDTELIRDLRLLQRTTLMLQTELRHGHVDGGLIDEIDRMMERGIATDPRCAELRDAVDALRENTLTPRDELHGDTIRACEALKDRIDAVIGQLV